MMLSRNPFDLFFSFVRLRFSVYRLFDFIHYATRRFVPRSCYSEFSLLLSLDIVLLVYIDNFRPTLLALLSLKPVFDPHVATT